MIKDLRKKKVAVVVQARMGSTRLPGKVGLEILGKPILVMQMERMLASNIPDSIVVATTTSAKDDDLIGICKEYGFNFFRGNENDLLDRHYQAAKALNADICVKIPSDCPLIDPQIIDKVLSIYLENIDIFDFVSNLHPASYPDGNDVEVIPMNILETGWREAKKDFEREHTTPFFWENHKRFRIGNVVWETGLDYSMSHRFTIDYPEDFEFIKTVYEELYPKNNLFSLN